MGEIERNIHVQWEGPLSMQDVKQLFNKSKDRGLYQVYGHHPVYGSGALLYVGQTKESFAERIVSENWLGGSMEDPTHVEVYVGRLKGEIVPPKDEWDKQIDLAEKLLIHAHGPAYNSRNIMSCESDREICSTRVFNWGSRRALNPEVSGTSWTSASSKFTNYRVYEITDTIATAVGGAPLNNI